MPASSVDTFFACSLMVILIASAMVSTAKLVQPYLNDLTNVNGVDRCSGLAEYLLLDSGNPSNWGRTENTTPSTFGIAGKSLQPYALDPDKVSRLNSENIFSLTYQQLLAALGTADMSLNIRIQPVFQVSIDLVSNQNLGSETVYTFQVSTKKSGFPISTRLNCYVTVDSYVENVTSWTDSDGEGAANITLPNALNGTTLLAVFARAQAYPQMMAFNAYSFGHNSEIPLPNRTFLRLSPLHNTLNVSLRDPNLEISEAYVFTHGYHFSLSLVVSGNRSLKYDVPSLSEVSPKILVLNGNNGSTSFSEWTAYPQLPLEIGADFSDLNAKSKAVALTYVVSIDSVLYEAVITCRSVPYEDS
jgi:hypothetical protein